MPTDIISFRVYLNAVFSTAHRRRCFLRRWRLLLTVASISLILVSISTSTAAHANGPISQPATSSVARSARTPVSGAGAPMAGFAGIGGVTNATASDSVVYRADQIEYDFEDEVIILTGNARIQFQHMMLEAHRIEFAVRTDIVTAEGLIHPDVPDSVIGFPRFTSGSESFTGTRLTYNIETRQGVVHGGASQSPEGFYYGDVVKRTGDEQLDVRDGVYTTCDHEHPHYAFRSSKMRVLIGDKVIAKPVVVEVADVPVFWFPYGVFFVDQHRRSGFLSPTMGENRIDGRYMEGLGYYFAPNDYFGAQALLSINERRDYRLRFTTQYALRYRLRGGVDYSYQQQWGQTGATIWNIAANHSQELTPRSNVQARINYTSSEQPQGTVGASQAAIINQTLTSSAGYTGRSVEGRSISADTRLTKNLQSGSVSATFPRVSVSSGQQYVFAQPQPRGPRATEPPGEPEWWRKAGYSWSWTGSNFYERGPDDSDIFDTWLFHERFADSTITYRLVLTKQIDTGYDGTYFLSARDESGGSTRLADGRIRTVETSTDSIWLFTGSGHDSTLAYIEPGSGRDGLRATVPGFLDEIRWNRQKIAAEHTQSTSQSFRVSLPLPTPRWINVTPNAGWNADWYSEPQPFRGDTSVTARHAYTAGISSSMNAYGTYPVNVGPVIAFRHIVTPSVSASYNLTRQMADTDYIFGGTQIGGDTSRVIRFGLNNVFQMKALVKGEEVRLDRLVTLDTGIAFNVDADGRRWSDPTTTVTVNPTRNFNVRLGMVHSFYQVDSLGQDVGFDWLDPTTKRLNVLSTLNFAGGGRSSSEPGREGYVGQQKDDFDRRGLELTQEERDRRHGQLSGSRWNPGWNVNLRHSYGWSRRDPRSAFTPRRTNEIDIAVDIAPFADWKVGYTTKYDFVDKRRIGDTMNIVRRLHCWEAKLDWVMTGPRRGYYFQIYVIGLPDVKIQAKSDTGHRL